MMRGSGAHAGGGAATDAAAAFQRSRVARSLYSRFGLSHLVLWASYAGFIVAFAEIVLRLDASSSTQLARARWHAKNM